MKILAIADLHGKLPKNLKKEAERADLIIALGDYANADEIRNLIFKNWAGKAWYESVGIKKASQLEKESFDSGLKVLKKLNSLEKPVYLIWGNADFYKDYQTSKPPIIMPGFYDNKIKKMKNLILIDKKMKKIDKIRIFGFGGYVDSTIYLKNSLSINKKKHLRVLKRYNKTALKLKNLLKKYNFNRDNIFAFHYPLLGILDRVNFKGIPMYGKHLGWKPYNEVIRKYKPKLVLCGHMHEYQGKKKLGKSLVVNPGEGGKGKFAVIDYPSLKVKFIK